MHAYTNSTERADTQTQNNSIARALTQLRLPVRIRSSPLFSSIYRCQHRRSFGDYDRGSKERSKEMWIDVDVTLR